jgi:protocatechuate 3,4-dioxygenase beta subunit
MPMLSPIRGLLLPFFLICGLIAQSPDTSSAAPTKGTISGIVTDAATGQPLKKATIAFRNTRSGGQRFQQPLAVTTGSDGRYSMAVEAGEYRLVATRNGYVRQAYGEKDARRPGMVFTVTSGQELKDINFRLVPGGVISGRVIDEDGEPMSGVSVQALRATYQDGERRLQPGGGSTRTDDRGEYRIFGLSPRRYYVSAARRGFGDFMLVAEDRPDASLGMQQQSEGYPTTYYPGTTDSNAASPIEMKAGEEQRINFSLLPSRTHRITGRVFDSSGQPVKDGFGMLLPRTGGSMMATSFAQVHDGKLDIHGVTPGSYSLMVGTRDEESEAAQRDIEVGDQDVTGLQLTLSRGSEIRGTVKFVDFSGTRPDLNVMLLPKSAGKFFGMSSATVKVDNSFVVKDVFPQDYLTTISNIPNTAYLKSVRVGGEETVTTGFNGAKGTTMEIVISGKAGTIEGTVTKSDGSPFPGATVVLVSDKPIRTRRGGGPETASTDQNGHFTFRGLRPANYSLSAWEDIDDEEYLDPDFTQRQASNFTDVKLSEGDSQNLNLKLITSDKRLTASQ